jgi:hypothetical protein
LEITMQRRSFLAASAAALVPASILTKAEADPEPPTKPSRTPPKPAPVAWSPDALQSVLEVCRQDVWAPHAWHYTGPCRRANWWTAFIALGWETGLRHGELLRLCCGDVDLAGRRLTIRPEVSKTTLPITLSPGDLSTAALADDMLSHDDALLFLWTGSRVAFHRQHAKILACAGVIEPRGRVRVAIVQCPGFEPKTWDDVPARYCIVETSEPMSLCEARQRAKWFNQPRRLQADEWAIVISARGTEASRLTGESGIQTATEHLRHYNPDMAMRHYLARAQASHRHPKTSPAGEGGAA